MDPQWPPVTNRACKRRFDRQFLRVAMAQILGAMGHTDPAAQPRSALWSGWCLCANIEGHVCFVASSVSAGAGFLSQHTSRFVVLIIKKQVDTHFRCSPLIASQRHNIEERSNLVRWMWNFMRFTVGIGACEKLRHEGINALTFRWIHCRDMKTNHQLSEGPTLYLTPCQCSYDLLNLKSWRNYPWDTSYQTFKLNERDVIFLLHWYEVGHAIIWPGSLKSFQTDIKLILASISQRPLHYVTIH